jgi:hypothetical protein
MREAACVGRCVGDAQMEEWRLDSQCRCELGSSVAAEQLTTRSVHFARTTPYARLREVCLDRRIAMTEMRPQQW